MVSPIDGLVTRRNIEEGETAVVGTMNNAGTVLLTIADLSVIETEIEVDETDIPFIKIGQPAKITIDAIPDKTFPGKVTEVGNSPIQAAGARATGRATNFKVVVTIDGAGAERAAGFTCTAVDHDGDAPEGARRADSGDDRARARRRRRRADRPAPKRRPGGSAPRGPAPGPAELQARPDAQGDRRRLPRQGRPRGVRAGQDRHRRREVLRGARRPEGRRRSDHRAVRVGARRCATATPCKVSSRRRRRRHGAAPPHGN